MTRAAHLATIWGQAGARLHSIHEFGNQDDEDTLQYWVTTLNTEYLHIYCYVLFLSATLE